MTEELRVREETLFPDPVQELLRTLHGVGFFEDSVLVGSWVMPIYGRLFGTVYPLRTLDIDFAVQLASAVRSGRTDLEETLLALGYVPSTSNSGVQRFTREGFTVEFLVHRRGGRDRGAVFVRSWNITAQPLPFLNLLLDHVFSANLGTCTVKVPLPEAFFVHKLITAQRRLEAEKSSKDLEQCAAIAPKLGGERLRAMMQVVKLSPAVKKALRASARRSPFRHSSLESADPVAEGARVQLSKAEESESAPGAIGSKPWNVRSISPDDGAGHLEDVGQISISSSSRGPTSGQRVRGNQPAPCCGGRCFSVGVIW